MRHLQYPRKSDRTRKLSESHKGKHPSLETRRKMSESQKGRKHSLETRKKISETNKGKKFSLEHKRKLSEFRKGKKLSLETRRKMSESKKGEKNYWFGKHPSLETRRKMSESRKDKKLSAKHKRNISEANKGRKHSLESIRKMSGENNPRWLGGKSFEPYGIDFNKKLKEIIRIRDGYRCQECFKHQNEVFTKEGKPKKLSIHHIDYNKRNNKPFNLISLCPKCHTKTNFKREDWTKHFQKAMAL